MDLTTAATFALAFLVFAARPGPDNITVLSKTVNEGPAHGIAYACGMVASILGFVVLAALGFDAAAAAVGDHLRLVRYAGAAYLVYTGVALWRAPVAVAARPLRGGLGRLFAMGFLLNASNPKMPIFYLALLPSVLGAQRITAADTSALLAIVVAVEVLVVGAHVGLALRAKAALSHPRAPASAQPWRRSPPDRRRRARGQPLECVMLLLTHSSSKIRACSQA